MPNPPSAAAALYPHLKSDDPPKQAQRAQSLSAAMYPALTQRAKAWAEWRERDRQSLLKGLRELNAKIDARLARE
jgi:hypothetical protein